MKDASEIDDGTLAAALEAAAKESRKDPTQLPSALDTRHKQTGVDKGDDGLFVHYYQDVEPIMDIAARERRIDRERTVFQRRPEFRRTMTVPFNILLKLKTERGLDFLNPDHSKAIAKILKSGEYKAFRTVNDKRI